MCDTPVPPVVIEAAKRGIDQGSNTYTWCHGLVEMRQVLAKRMGVFNHTTVNPETEVTVCAGSTGAFHCVCMAFLQLGHNGKRTCCISHREKPEWQEFQARLFPQGDHSARYVRFSFAQTNADLDIACECLQKLGDKGRNIGRAACR